MYLFNNKFFFQYSFFRVEGVVQSQNIKALKKVWEMDIDGNLFKAFF